MKERFLRRLINERKKYNLRCGEIGGREISEEVICPLCNKQIEVGDEVISSNGTLSVFHYRCLNNSRY